MDAAAPPRPGSRSIRAAAAIPASVDPRHRRGAAATRISVDPRRRRGPAATRRAGRYTFGESDLYRSLRHPLYRKLCHFTLSKGGFVVPCFWGPRWWCPLLPRDDVPLHTVIAEPVQLPLIPNPTNEDVAHWHAKYVAAVVAIYDGHKVRFGYGDRVLEVF